VTGVPGEVGLRFRVIARAPAIEVRIAKRLSNLFDVGGKRLELPHCVGLSFLRIRKLCEQVISHLIVHDTSDWDQYRPAPVSGTHTFRKIRLRYSSHTGTKQTAVKLTE
jgi:hypothetical protein